MHTRNGAELTVWRKWADFSKAVQDCREWENDSDRHGVGSVALSFNRGEWVVLVSQDLIDAELPF